MKESTLPKKHCVPCEGGVKTLTSEQSQKMLTDLAAWDIREGKLRKNFRFPGFKEAIRFVNDLADLAEEQGHHPDMEIHYNQVLVLLWTHAINGLSENDFILAAKIDELMGDIE